MSWRIFISNKFSEDTVASSPGTTFQGRMDRQQSPLGRKELGGFKDYKSLAWLEGKEEGIGLVDRGHNMQRGYTCVCVFAYKHNIFEVRCVWGRLMT